MKGIKKLLNKVSIIYQNRIKTRKEIASEYGLDEVQMTCAFKRRGIEIWDKDDKKELIDKLAELYKNRVYSRKQIYEMYKIEPKNLKVAFRNRGIEIWDLRQAKKEEKENKESPYHNWKELCNESSYAVMFYKYNE